jgi:mRNA interferase MazF
MDRGEVRRYTFKSLDKKRPVLIVSLQSVIPYLGEVTIAPSTSIIRDIPTEVVLGTTEGMPTDCAVNCDHLQAVSKAQLGKVITRLSSGHLQQVSQAIRFALDL